MSWEKEDIGQSNFWGTSLKQMSTFDKVWTPEPHIFMPSLNKTPYTGSVIKNSTRKYVANIRLEVSLSNTI